MSIPHNLRNNRRSIGNIEGIKMAIHYQLCTATNIGRN